MKNKYFLGKEDSIAEYLKEMWCNSDDLSVQFSSLNLMIERGFIEMACDYIVGAGAVEYDNVIHQNGETKIIELLILRNAHKYSKKGHQHHLNEINELLEGIAVYVLKETNETIFIDMNDLNDDLESNLNEYGYEREGEI